ncbi:MAG: peptide chain release factor N(5)-glutamine methyltransferase [Deltaproteobacteria bacterium HGW-Deltaproteobacteria-19]|jgi:release factor glutamine methyltransferase|nr:MAG: peptide chain release factor N(5)-glutamine methyltransferase [Deltaproteobacteria bacterium HGW-Deltaproteobacteria-19]
MATIRSVLHEATDDLHRHGLPSPRLDAEVLLCRYLGTDRTHLYAHPEEIVGKDVVRGFMEWVGRRQRQEPVAYIVGEKEFWSIPFSVDRHVLIPRADTEILVEEAIRVAKAGCDILDVGTGSGAVAVALSRELPRARVVATDRSIAAAVTAAGNAKRAGVADRVLIVVADLLESLRGPFDVIVSNPPYIPEDEFEGLPPGVREYEPKEALWAPGDGTAVHRRLISDAPSILKDGGWLLMEMGDRQAKRLTDVLQADGRYDRIDIRKDYGGRDRVVKARRMEITHG